MERNTAQCLDSMSSNDETMGSQVNAKIQNGLEIVFSFRMGAGFIRPSFPPNSVFAPAWRSRTPHTSVGPFHRVDDAGAA